jgi:hypothetical protein
MVTFHESSQTRKIETLFDLYLRSNNIKMQGDFIVAYISDSEEEQAHEWTGTYHPSFPNEWTLSHEPGTGPEQCTNCTTFGTHEGQFIGYCANCATVYEGARGRGFIDVCTELVSEETVQWASVFETYLHHVDFARFSEDILDVDQSDHNEVPVVSDDEDDTFEFVGEGTVFEAHYEGGYADF